MASTFRVFASIDDVLDGLLKTNIDTISDSLINGVASTTIGLALTLFLVCTGYLLAIGKITMHLGDYLWMVGKMACIYIFSLNVGGYGHFLADSLYQLPTHLVSIVTSGFSNDPNTQNMQFIDSIISQSYDQYLKVYELAIAKSNAFGIPSIALLALAFAILGLGIVAGTVAGGYLLISKFILAGLLAIGPLFVMCLIFKATEGYFEKYLGMCITMVLLSLILSVSVRIGFGLIWAITSRLDVAINEENAMISMLAIPIVLVLSIMMFVKSDNIAGAIGGGASIDVGRALDSVHGKMGGAVRSFVDSSRGSGTRVVNAGKNLTGNLHAKITGRNNSIGSA